MKVKLALLLTISLLCVQSLSAQRALTLSDLPAGQPMGQALVSNLVEADSAYSVQIAAAATRSGSNQTWDFSGAPDTEDRTSDTLRYVSPSSTPFANLFPGATHASFDGVLTYSYHVANEQRFELLGTAADVLGAVKIERYTNYVWMTFPFAFGQETNQNYRRLSWWDNDPENIDTLQALLKLRYSGNGKVLLPQGAFDDVVQLREEETMNLLDGEYFSQNATYRYVHLPSRKTVALFYDFYTRVAFDTDTLEARTLRFEYTSDAPTSRNASAAPALLGLHPNPSTGQVLLTHYQREAGEAQIEVTDLTGRSVMRQALVANAGLNETRLDIDAPAGVYTVRLTTAAGSGAQKLILN